MQRVRAWVFAVVAAVLWLPGLARAQDGLKTINKPGTMQAAVSTEDENKKPLKLKKGEKVTIIYSRDEWMWVKTKGGRGGWVLKDKVKLDEGGAAAPAPAPAPAGGEEAAPAGDGKKKEDKKAKEEEKRRAAEEKKAAAEEAKRKKEEEKKAKEEEKKRAAEEKKAAAEEAKRKKEEEKRAAEEAKKAAAAPAPAPAPAPEPAPVAMPPPETAVAPEPQPAPAPQLAMATPAPQPAAYASPVSMAAGWLTVMASEPGAAVLVDGQRVGDAPVRRLQVGGGRHKVTVMKDEFTASEQDVEINGNEANVALALAPTPEVVGRHKMAVFRNWGLGFAALGAGAAGALVFGLAGLGGALLWTASTVAFTRDQANATTNFNDPVSEALAPALANPVAILAGAGLTFTGPVLALLAGVGGSILAAAMFMTAGDLGRYTQYQE